MSGMQWLESNQIVFGVPTFIFMTLYMYIFITWVFATDFYDKFHVNHKDDLTMFNILFFFSVINFVIGLFYSWFNPISCIINGFIFLVLLLFFVDFLYNILKKINNHFLIKRGKKC
ncbi:hypothetical protein [Yersinia phage fHe-Yen9-03]|uniref:Uncharacterized protein n=1 Tax=Yersinia phage fHe-Yen9-03 TaxID=2052743 RepID=A0A2C9D109_9CAUD|nr:hypothetical protein [Yersinia phage fHe-Yen9-03]